MENDVELDDLIDDVKWYIDNRENKSFNQTGLIDVYKFLKELRSRRL